MPTVEVKGIGLVEFPDTMNQDDIAFVLRNSQRSRTTRVATPAEIDRGRNAKELAEGTKLPFFAGMGEALSEVPEGLKQLYYQMAQAAYRGPKGDVPAPVLESQQKVAEMRQELQPLTYRSQAAELGQFAGATVPGLLVPPSRGGALARFATDVITGAGQGAVAPLAPGQSRAGSIAGGTIGAAAPSGVMNTSRALRDTGGAAREAYELGRRHDVDLTAGEIKGSGVLQRTETLLERVPAVGIAGFRRKQSAQVHAAARRLRDRYDVDVSDIGEELQQGITRAYEANKKEVSKLYDRVGELSKKTDEKIVPSNRRELASQLLADEQELGPLANPQLVKYLETYATSEPLTFDAARKLRSRMWDEVRQAEKQSISGGVSEAEVRLKTRMAQALERDIEDWAERAGETNKEILRAYRHANTEFRDKVAPFKDRDIKKAIATDDTDTIIATFLKRDRPKLAAKFRDKVDERTQTALKFSIIDRAFKTAESLPDVEFSPLVFARELERLKSTNKAVFTQAEQQELQGMVKLMQIAQRAGKFRENVPTGNRAVDLGAMAGAAALGTYAVRDPVGAATLVGGVRGLSLLLTTNAGRSILTDISRAAERSPAMNRLLFEARRELEYIVDRSAGTAGALLGQ